MSGSYIPSKDTDFSTWLQNFLTYVTAHAAELGITGAQIAALGALQTTWNASLAAHQQAQIDAKTRTKEKLADRKAMEEALRPIVSFIQDSATTTDAMRQAMGLTVSGGAVPSDAEISEEKPLPIIDMGSRMKHVIRVNTVTSTGTKRARPAGMIGCELWRKIGETPSGVDDMEYVGIVKKTPYVIEYSDAEAGKMAHYAMRWINGRGEPGSWSETESATIAA